MKKLLTLILCVSLAFAMAVPAFASCDDGPQETKYISRVYGLGYYGFTYFGEACKCCGFPDNTDNVVGNAINSNTDFNKGCGGDSAYVRMMQEFTTDPNAAITDLIVVYTYVGHTTSSSRIINDCKYYVVSGACAYDTNSGFSTKKVECSQFTFNEHEYDDEDCQNEVYLLYTTDPRAGAPITKLNILMGQKHANDSNLVGVYKESGAADFNKGYGDTRIYLQMERAQTNTASVFNTTASVVTISVCVVIILGVMGFVIIKKRKGVAQ